VVAVFQIDDLNTHPNMTIQIQISKCSRTLKHDLTVKMMKTVNGHFVLISADK
jgi:hypothetical protein